MRFMMLMIPAVYQGDMARKAGPDFSPSVEAVERMMKYNEELARSGVLIALDGLQPPVTGARVSFAGGKPQVLEGAAPDAKNVLGGYWMIRVPSLQEAIEWAKRVPAEDGDVVELRQVFETADFPEDVRRAADNPAVTAEIARHTMYDSCC